MPSPALSERGKNGRDAVPFDVLEGLAAEDRVKSSDLSTSQTADVSHVVRNIGISEGARRPVEGVDIVPDVDEEAGDEPETGADLENFEAIDLPQQMNLRPLVDNSLSRVIFEPILFPDGIGP